MKKQKTTTSDQKICSNTVNTTQQYYFTRYKKKLLFDFDFVIPKEIFILILNYFSVSELCNYILLVSKVWYNTGIEDLIWKKFCFNRWKDKHGMTLNLYHKTKFQNPEAINENELINILLSRHIRIPNPSDKIELIKLLLNSQKTKLYYGNCKGNWRASFIAAELDSERTRPTATELCSVNWFFKFKGSDWAPNKWIARFHMDGTFELIEKENIIILRSSMHWHFTNKKGIQINRYHPHRVSRLDNWGWKMENDWVIMSTAAFLK